MTQNKVKILGDPHLGRSFIHGVPLHRRGEREEMVWAAFAENLKIDDPDVALHVNMGDLFDKAIVSYDVIVRAADLYRKAAKAHPTVTFIILKGNHDWMRDLDRSSAFDIFARLIADVTNIKTIVSPTVIGDYLFVAYDPLTPAADLIAAKDYSACKIAFGHWDQNGFGSEHNVVPTRQLSAQGIPTAITGHVHKPDTFTRDGVSVIITGSMQPYAFGEQADDTLYVEHTLDSLKDATDLTNKVVRVTLAPGELLEDSVDCLQLVVARLKTDDHEAPVVTMGDFDMESLFRQAFETAGVSEKLTETMIGNYNDKRLSAAD